MTQKKNRPAGTGRLTTTTTTVTRIRRECPLITAALRIGDYEILLAVAELHPAERCPARRERAA
jgi:hypothetical protein